MKSVLTPVGITVALAAVIFSQFCCVKALVLCNVKDYGAVGDGVTYEDDSFINALLACSNTFNCKVGEIGRVVVPRGRYLLSPFNLTSNVELHLETGSVLLPTTDFTKWPTIPEFPSYPDDGITKFAAFIGGEGIENVTISGHGTIDGQGQAWWDAADAHTIDNHGRPRLIEPTYCSNFKVSGITIVNPPYWAVHPYACDGVVIENVLYESPVTSANTDGIDPDSCTNVIIRNFTATCGDDAIAIKSGKNEEGRAFARPSHNILIEGGTIGPSSSINIGSEMSGNVYNVMVKGVTFKGSLFSSRIKTARGRGGFVKNITFQDLVLTDCAMGPSINMYYSGNDHNMAPFNDITTPHISNIHYLDHRGSAIVPGAFFCLPESPCMNIEMNNVNISSIGKKFECINAHGNSTGIIVPESCL